MVLAFSSATTTTIFWNLGTIWLAAKASLKVSCFFQHQIIPNPCRLLLEVVTFHFQFHNLHYQNVPIDIWFLPFPIQL